MVRHEELDGVSSNMIHPAMSVVELCVPCVAIASHNKDGLDAHGAILHDASECMQCGCGDAEILASA